MAVRHQTPNKQVAQPWLQSAPLHTVEAFELLLQMLDDGKLPVKISIIAPAFSH
jgi:hypothetical protein